MEKSCKIAKVLDTIAKVVGGICTGFLCALIILSLLYFVGGIESVVDYQMSIELGSLELWVAEAYWPHEGTIKLHLLFAVLLAGVSLMLTIFAVRIIRKILRPMKEGNPFAEDVCLNLKKLGWFVLIGGGVYSVMKAVSESVLLSAYDVVELIMNEKFTGYTVTTQLDMTFLVVAGIIFLLSYIFHYGLELQKLSDETL